MDPEIRIILTIILPIIIILSFSYGAAHFTKERTLMSEYEYRVNINPEEEIEDVNITITVPFPSNLSEGSFSPYLDGWTTEINEQGNNLSIYADYIPAGSNSTLHLSMRSDEEIDTHDPLNGEPVLGPKEDLTEVESDDSSDSDPEKCYTYTSIIEITYDSEEEIDIEIYVELTGTNRWWMLGDIENQYHDRLSVKVEGEGDFEAEGRLKTGIGDY